MHRRFMHVCSSTFILMMTLLIVLLSFDLAEIHYSLIMAAKGGAIASIDGAVKFLAQRRRLHYNNLAFSVRPKRIEGTMTQVLFRKKKYN